MSLARAILAPAEARAGSEPITWTELQRVYEEGSKSEAGVSVSSEKAMTVAAWWRGVNLIANSVAKLGSPRVLRRSDGGFKVDAAHPAARALRRIAGMHHFAFMHTRMVHKVARGNGYALVLRLGSGAPDEIVPLDPTRVTPFRENGRLLYLYQFADPAKRAVKLDESSVLHFKGCGWDGLVGYSRVEKAREVLGLSMASRTHASKFFANGARLGVLLEHPAQMSDVAKERFLAGWRAAREGVDQAWKTVILEEGLKASQPLTMSAKDAQLIEEQQFNNRELANILDLPVHKLGDVATKTFASVEEENQSFLDDSIDPHLVEAEEEFERKLLTEQELASGDVQIEFDRARFLRANLKARGEANKAAVAGMPWKTINEVRAEDGYPSIPGYDELKVPINLQEAADAGSGADPKSQVDGPQKDPPAAPPPPAPDPAAGETERMRAAMDLVEAEARRRVVSRVAKDARRAAKDPRRFGEWLEAARREHLPAVLEILTPAAACRAARDGRGQDLHQAVLVSETLGAVLEACDRAYSSAKPAEFAAAIESTLAPLETQP